MDLESAPGTRAEALHFRSAYHGICQLGGLRTCFCRRTRMHREARATGFVRASEVRTSFFYKRLSWLSFYLATGRDAALSCRSSALSTRAQAGAQRLPPRALCCTHRPLSLLLLALAVSRK